MKVFFLMCTCKSEVGHSTHLFFFLKKIRFYSLHVRTLQDCTKLVIGGYRNDEVRKSSVQDGYVRESLIEARHKVCKIYK